VTNVSNKRIFMCVESSDDRPRRGWEWNSRGSALHFSWVSGLVRMDQQEREKERMCERVYLVFGTTTDVTEWSIFLVLFPRQHENGDPMCGNGGIQSSFSTARSAVVDCCDKTATTVDRVANDCCDKHTCFVILWHNRNHCFLKYKIWKVLIMLVDLHNVRLLANNNKFLYPDINLIEIQ
jgi:hypothetical protein